MLPALVISSVASDAVLTIEKSDTEYVTVSVEGDAVAGRLPVWTYDGTKSLAEFFQSLAHDWRGWVGSKTWVSAEGEFRIDATCDLKGHVRLVVHLVRDAGRRDPWSFRASFELEAGRLEAIAREARRARAVD